MLFREVIKISKFEEMRFSIYFDVSRKSSSYLVPCSYEAL